MSNDYIKFDYDLYLTGEYDVYSYGKKVHDLVKLPSAVRYCLAGVVEGEQNISSYRLDGSYICDEDEDNWCLKLKKKTTKRYFNVYLKKGGKSIWTSGNHYPTRESAVNWGTSCFGLEYVDTIEIEI